MNQIFKRYEHHNNANSSPDLNQNIMRRSKKSVPSLFDFFFTN